jgi:hypothetical protein
MSQPLIITGRIMRQGPQAPLAGYILALPVYEYEVVEPAGELRSGARLDVAHRNADVDDPGFAVGRLRRLQLAKDFPPRSTLLFWHDHPRRGERVWFAIESTPV